MSKTLDKDFRAIKGAAKDKVRSKLESKRDAVADAVKLDTEEGG